MSETNPYLVYVIGDYGDDLAFNEVHMRIDAAMGDIPYRLYDQNVPAFDTVSTGFTLGQLALNVPTQNGYAGRVKFFVNTAPRKDDPKAREKCAGEALVYFRLKNGVEGVCVNSGYSLSFVKDSAEEIRLLEAASDGSQFRSRDVFPQAFGEVMHGNNEIKGKDITDQIPDPEEDVVAFTDGYGNLKCSIDPRKMREHKGKHIKIYINRLPIFAKIADGIFGVEDGEFCVSEGSSGWVKSDGTHQRFTEIVRRGGNAAETVNYPLAGKKIIWEIVE